MNLFRYIISTVSPLILFTLITGCQNEEKKVVASVAPSTCASNKVSNLAKSLKPKTMAERFIDTIQPDKVLVSKTGNVASLLPGTEVIVGYKTDCGGGFDVLEVGQQVSIDEYVAPFEADECVSYLEHNKKLYTTSLKTSASFNDTLSSNQGHLSAINFSAAYDKFYDATNGIQNQTAVIAIMDTGIQGTHPDLTGKFWSNTDEIAGNSIDDDGNGRIDDTRGFNFADNIGDPEPIAWTGNAAEGEIHGTHVAGLAAASINNAEGVVGIGGPNVTLMDLNIFGGDAGADVSTAAAAIDYAIANGANVLNISLATQQETPTLNTKIQEAVAAGLVVVIAAGNEGKEVTTSFPVSPGFYGSSHSGAITVGATYSNTLARTSYSNYSPTFVELMAPGSDDTGNTGLMSTRTNSTYTRLDGTSMATPVVSGAAALAYAYMKEKGSTPTPAQIETWLKSSGTAQDSLDSCVQNAKHLDLNALYNTLSSQ